MKQSPNYLFRLGMVLIALGAVGCKSNDLLKNAPGNYDGLVINTSSSSSKQIPVSGKVSSVSQRDLAINVVSTDGKSNWDFQIHVDSAKELDLTADALFKGPSKLSQDGDNCFAGSAPQVRLCYDGSEVSLDYMGDGGQEEIFVLDRHVDSDHPVLEAPKNYTVSELLEMGKNKSFTSQIQFQTSVQSRQNSVAAHLSLLPSISYGAVVGVISFQLSSMTSLIGNLAPFLIPSNWVAASSARHQSDADYYAYLLMEANSANIAEGIAYATLRDTNTLALMKTYEAPLGDMIQIIHEQELMGLLAKGSENSLATILNSLKQTEIQLQEVITEETRSLAAGIGLENPDGISGITDVDDSALITPPADLSLTDMQNIAIDRSMELRQVNSLLGVRKDASLNNWLSWVSPTGSVSFALPAQIQGAKAGEVEIEREHDQVQNAVLQKVEDAASEVKTALNTYNVAKQNEATLQTRLDQLESGIKSGLSVSVSDLQLAVTDKMAGDTSLISAKYSYYTAVGLINRMLLAGPYLDILTQVGKNRDAPKP